LEQYNACYLYYQSWSGDTLEMIIVIKLVKKSPPPIMEPEDSSLCLLQSPTGPYPGLD